jgi:hypothetical protein
LIIRRRRKRRRGVITISNARIPFHFKHQLIEFAMEIFTLTISAQSLNILSQSNLLENATHRHNSVNTAPLTSRWLQAKDPHPNFMHNNNRIRVIIPSFHLQPDTSFSQAKS